MTCMQAQAELQAEVGQLSRRYPQISLHAHVLPVTARNLSSHQPSWVKAAVLCTEAAALNCSGEAIATCL